jgi:5-oxoprolinase (ATP-hydrolysing)
LINQTKLIGFDMGGTSTDVSRFEGNVPEMIYETEIDGIDVQMPHLHIGKF